MKNILLLVIFIALISCSKNPSDPAAPDTTGEDSSKPKTWLDTVKNKKATETVTGASPSYIFLENGDIDVSFKKPPNDIVYKYIFQYAPTPTNAVYEELTNSVNYGFRGFLISNENILCYTADADTAEDISWTGSISKIGPLEDR